ncbi:hypothetical protein ABFS83_08G063100 [Erythranthe nasuta]
MASSLQRLASNSSKAYRSASAPFSRAFSAGDSPAGDMGMVSGIPQEHLRQKVSIVSPATQQGSGKLGRWKNNFISTQKSLTRTFVCRTLCTAMETRTQKLERIASELLDLNKIERHDYVILLRYKMGINRYGPAVSAPGPQSPSSAGGGAAPAAAKEKTAFDVKLEKFDPASKLKVIKEIRAFTDLGLKEAKDLVEKTPSVVKKGVTKEEAEKIVAKLKELGATVVLE